MFPASHLKSNDNLGSYSERLLATSQNAGFALGKWTEADA